MNYIFPEFVVNDGIAEGLRSRLPPSLIRKESSGKCLEHNLVLVDTFSPSKPRDLIHFPLCMSFFGNLEMTWSIYKLSSKSYEIPMKRY